MLITVDYPNYAKGNKFTQWITKHKYEKERYLTQNLNVLSLHSHAEPKWKRYHFIDTPGAKKLSHKVLRALSMSDAAILVIPLIIDHFNSDFNSSESQIKD